MKLLIECEISEKSTSVYNHGNVKDIIYVRIYYEISDNPWKCHVYLS